MKITLLATGFGIQDIHMKEMDNRISQRSVEEQQRLAELEEKEEERRNRRERFYDDKGGSKQRKRRHIYIFSAEDLDNEDIIAHGRKHPDLPAQQDNHR